MADFVKERRANLLAKNVRIGPRKLPNIFQPKRIRGVARAFFKNPQRVRFNPALNIPRIRAGLEKNGDRCHEAANWRRKFFKRGADLRLRNFREQRPIHFNLLRLA